MRTFVPGTLYLPGFDAIVPPIDASAVVHTCSSSRRTPDPLTAAFSATLTTPALNRRSLRWFGLPACTANPEDLPPSLAQHGSCRRPSTSPHSPFRTHPRSAGTRSPWGPDVSLRRSGQVSGRQRRRAADRQAALVSVGALPGGALAARDAGGEGGDRAVNDDAAQRGRGKGKAMIAPGSPPE